MQDFFEPSMRTGDVSVFEEIKGVTKLAVNKHASRTTKHIIHVKYYLARDAGKIKVAYVVRTGDSTRELAEVLHANTALREV